MDTKLSSDKPVSLEQEDRFQRYGFCKRIAQTIIDRESEDCIVIGIYGAWGEGKTSVINFIEKELVAKENIITVKFNPWRYNDENTLLLQFFEKLASVLDAKLKTSKEKAGEIIKKYGKLLTVVPFIGNASDSIEAAGELLSNVDVETLKDRIGQLLKENGKRVAVFIDDIDRLEKTEIHSVFRLVKLTDELMVSAAIAERFGEGNQKAGENFLEKIIQVPLKIPVAQPDALKEFALELVEQILAANNITLDQKEAGRFASEFIENLLSRLNTPRLAVRYSNTLSFSIPLLNQEVNIVDLMLIEGIKIFYPDHYAFIKHNPEFFIGSYSNVLASGKSVDKKGDVTHHFEVLSKDLTKKQKRAIEDLLQGLFPRLKEAFSNYHHNENNELDWYKRKKICSAQYFDRYFSMSVIKGQISDVAFQTLITDIPHRLHEHNVEAFKRLISESTPESFLQKLRTYEEEFAWPVSVLIAKLISKLSDVLPKNHNGSFLFGYGSPYSQAAIFIRKLIEKHEKVDESLRLAKELLVEATQFDFAFEVYKWLIRQDTSVKQIFSEEENNDLAKILLSRALDEAGEKALYDAFPEYSNFLFSTWSDFNRPEVYDYVKERFERDAYESVKVLRTFTRTMYSSAYPEPYKSNLSEEEYKWLVSIFDKELFKTYIMKNFSEEEIKETKIKWNEHDGPYQTDLNIVCQFMHWYNEEDYLSEDKQK